MQRNNYLVLMVDDNAELRELFYHKLAKENFQVLGAEHGRQALEQLQVVKVDLILLDLEMTEMDGFEFVEVIKHDVTWSQIPIIVFSSKILTSEERARLTHNIEIIVPKGNKGIDRVIKEIKKVLG